MPSGGSVISHYKPYENLPCHLNKVNWGIMAIIIIPGGIISPLLTWKFWNSGVPFSKYREGKQKVDKEYIGTKNKWISDQAVLKELELTL